VLHRQNHRDILLRYGGKLGIFVALHLQTPYILGKTRVPMPIEGDRQCPVTDSPTPTSP
jgi:hypothetical protein